MTRSLASTGQPLRDPSQEKATPASDQQLLLFFCGICVAFIKVAFVVRILQERAKKRAAQAHLVPKIPPAEIPALVSKLAHDVLDIGSHQLDQPIEKLRIAKGDFLSFLDNLELDHGLRVPASERTTSSSISSVISALCEET